MEEMRPALGLIEFKSIAHGIMTCDFMMKKAPIELLEAMPTCPGKYSVVIGGLVTATLLTLLVFPAIYSRFGGDVRDAEAESPEWPVQKARPTTTA